EQFEIEKQPDGDTKVQVFKITKEGERGKKLYDRTFKSDETREVRLYGLGGEDAFVVKGGKSDVRVRVIGGDGNDSVGVEANASTRKIMYYDHASDKLLTKGVRDKTSRDPAVNVYDRKAFQYNRVAPLIIGNYNPDDGLFIGGGLLAMTHGFRKNPFKQRHILTGSVAPRTESFNFLYRGTFADVVGKWDFDLAADVKSPNFVNNFFGWGNESVFDSEIDENDALDLDEAIDYYRYRFEELRLEPSLIRNFGRNSFIKIGPALQRIEMEEPDDDDEARFITDYASTLPTDLFNEYRSYVGANWQVMLDTRNNRNFARRGIALSVEGRNMNGLNKARADFSSYEGSLSIIHSFRSAGRLVFAVRAGGGINTGNYEFYQAQILSGRTELRGFRKTRFYGDRKFFSNFELRLRLKNFKSYLFPASFGVLAFHDLGRVWYEDESGTDPSAASGKSIVWHKGFGGGLWFTPFNLTVLSAEVGHSKEGTLAYVRLGFLF
ncbi:MAG TPA: BamA/TamA family outer membrane protein, partial [Chryseosolibacter sp.]